MSDTVETIYTAKGNHSRFVREIVDSQKDLTKRLGETNKRLEGFNGSLSKTVVVAKAVAAAFVAMKVGKMAFEMGELGAQAEAVNKNFEKFAREGGRNAAQSLEELRRASGGLIDDMTLQQQSLKAIIAGVNFDDIVTSLEFVRRFSIATGDDITQRFQTVMTGLARGSALFLDDVGIQVMGASDVVGAAIAQMEEKMDDFADTSDSTSTKIAQMKTEFVGLRQELGQMLAPTLGVIAEKITDITVKWREFLNTFDAAEDIAQAMTIEDRIAKTEKTLEQAQNRVTSLAKASHELNEEFAGATAQRDIDRYNQRFQDIRFNYNGARKEVEILTRKLQALRGEQKAQAEARAEAGVAAPTGAPATPQQLDLSFVDAQLEAANATFEAWTDANELIIDSNTKASSQIESIWQDTLNVLSEQQATRAQDEMERLEEQTQKMIELRNASFQAATMVINSIDSAFRQSHNRRMSEIDAETKERIKAVEATAKSEKLKAKEIEKIEQEARKLKHEQALADWRRSIAMIQVDTAAGIAKTWATVGYPAAIPLTIAMGAQSTIQTGVALANKPRFRTGSVDASGQPRIIGQGVGTSGGIDSQLGLFSPGELIVPPQDAPAVRDFMRSGGLNTTQTVKIDAPITIQGGATDEALAQIPELIEEGVARAIENQQYTNLFNPNLT